MSDPVRRSGAVLHLTWLPGPHGSGDLGADALRFVDWLAACGQTVWQVLPLGPVGFGNSPYQALSAFAGNPLLVALEPLVRRGWLEAAALDGAAFDARRVDFGAVIPWRMARLRQAARGFALRATPQERREFERWREGAAWLPDYALFMALKTSRDEAPWWLWPAPLRDRRPSALADAGRALADDVDFWCFAQWCFDAQLAALRAHARAAGVRLMGDVPIFVAHDSADCWARPDLYRLDARGQPTVVAGVPPDVYTPDGQRWGNPIYRWQRMAEEGFGWWLARLERAFEMADLVRIDHFRGFAGCWEIPAACPTAREGRWVAAPGHALFEAVAARMGTARIVAEDLGTITPDVVALRERFGLPGMRIVYEGFLYGPDHAFVPHHHVPDSVAYTSTHDSDTVAGWWRASSPAARAFGAAYRGLDAGDDAAPAHRAVHRATLASVARLALATMQDLLGLGSEHRMNRPGTGDGNWGWRFAWGDLPDDLAPWLAAVTAATARHPGAARGT